jgi:DNA mismatch repair protein MutL
VIRIDVEGGGKKRIRVTDNGSGMSSEDARRAFLRHATSKIQQQGDLEAIQTLGFRGEALPSIASVSKVRLTTAADESRGGTLVALEAGKGMSVKETACPRGTSVEIDQLFFNTPARKKFLKGDGTEFSHITQMAMQQALAHPNIHFTLVHNGRKTFDTPPTDHSLYRIAELFGRELARELVRVEAQSGEYQLTGYVSNPVYTRASRSAQYCFINQRSIRDKVILHATQHGYSHLLPKGRHPVIFLFLTMDPRLLDVNVHPSKNEVRFAYQQDVHRLVSDGVRKALAKSEKGPLEPVPYPEENKDGVGEGRVEEPGSPSPSSLESAPGAGIYRSGNPPAAPRYEKDNQPQLAHALKGMYGGETASCGAQKEGRPLTGFEPLLVSDLIYSEFEIMGQLDHSFIILQGPRGILVVDQHIAHERILYERFKQAAQNKKVEVQQLLFPVTLEFSKSEIQLLSGHLDWLNGLGLQLEPFGKSELLLRSVPAILKKDDHEKVLREIVEMLPQGKDDQALKQKHEDILIMMSCRNAIKINHPMGLEHIRNMIADLEKTEMPYTCPHGRPIALLFEMDGILRKFLRK